MMMKKLLLISMMLVCGMTAALAQKASDMKFDKTTHNFGKTLVKADSQGYIESLANGDPAVAVCTFTFTNEGNIPLVVNRTVQACGCTVPEYTKTPIKPGEKGEIKVTYNAASKFTGHFKKSIKVYTNFSNNITATIYIEGDMETK